VCVCVCVCMGRLQSLRDGHRGLGRVCRVGVLLFVSDELVGCSQLARRTASLHIYTRMCLDIDAERLGYPGRFIYSFDLCWATTSRGSLSIVGRILTWSKTYGDTMNGGVGSACLELARISVRPSRSILAGWMNLALRVSHPQLRACEVQSVCHSHS
jgi:hypothetical protein